MKRFLTAAIIMSAILSINAQAQINTPEGIPISSGNMIGYVNIPITNGELKLVSVPFTPMNSKDAFKTSEVFRDSLPVQSRVYSWDSVLRDWLIATYAWNSRAGTNVWRPDVSIKSGQGLLVKLPATPVGTYTISFLGSIPVDSTIRVPLAGGYTLIGYPYPVEVNITNTVFGTNAVDQDKILYWENGRWGSVTYAWDKLQEKFTWQPSNIVINIGMGVFYKSGSARTNEEVMPFPPF